MLFAVISALATPAATSADAPMSAAGTTVADATSQSGLCLDISNVPLNTQLPEAPAGVIAGMVSGSAISFNVEALQAGAVMYQAQYSTGSWAGDVKAFPIDQSTGAALRDTPLWSAAGRLDERNWNTGRLIVTYDGVEGVPFRFSDLTEEQKSALDPDWTTNDAIAAGRLKHLRGDQSKEIANGGSFRNRASLMGDIVHSSPVYQNGVLYVGGNDGMLHALDASNGEELFAYVPNLVFQGLRDLTSPSYEHRYFVDLTPAIRETGSGIYLAGGLGRGGKGLYCLDISDPFTVHSEAGLAENVLWEYPRISIPETERLDMGYTYSTPSIVNSNEGWVVIFGNGYCSPNEKAVLFVLDLLTGSCIARIDTGAGGCNGLSTPAVVDINNDAKADYAYAGDLKGNLWKFDLTASEASNWDVAYSEGVEPKPLFQAGDENGNPQPITTRPDVMFHCFGSMPGYIVVFGTGKYLGSTDLTDSSTQTIYGVWDYGDDDDDSEYLGRFERGAARQLSNQPDTVGLLEQMEVYYERLEGLHSRVLSDFNPDWVVARDEDAGEEPDPSSSVRNHAGWFFDFPLPKERVIRDPRVSDGKAIVISTLPKRTPNAAGGDSIVHQINACTGGRLSSPQIDITGEGMIDGQDRIEVPDCDYPGETIRAAPTGILFPSMVSSPRILHMPDGTKIDYFSSADGDILTLKTKGETQGFYYWRHLD